MCLVKEKQLISLKGSVRIRKPKRWITRYKCFSYDGICLRFLNGNQGNSDVVHRKMVLRAEEHAEFPFGFHSFKTRYGARCAKGGALSQVVRKVLVSVKLAEGLQSCQAADRWLFMLVP